VKSAAGATRNQVGAIVQAYWRCTWNRLPRITKGNVAVAILLGVLWYGLFVTIAFGAAALASAPGSVPVLPYVFAAGLMIAFIYWQVVPLLIASTGSSLELPKLIVYPVPPRSLFGIEVLLRTSSGVEILIVIAGASIGCLLNPKLPRWSPAGFLLFVIFNILLAAGMRDLLTRLLARRRIREMAIFFFVLMAALPQMSVFLARNRHLKAAITQIPVWFFPWTAAARIASGIGGVVAWIVICAWIVAAYLFGRWQFDRSLREVELSRPQLEAAGARRTFAWLLSWPSSMFRDPLGALAEKELRVLARAPRFRLAFIMGFSFGLMVFIPIAFQDPSGSWLRQNFLAIAMVYAVLLLADVLYWNIFGVDRAAAQSYFVYPPPVRSVIFAKNVATAFFTAIDASIVLIICLLIRIPVRPVQAAEAVCICVLIAVWLLAIGNLVSAYSPRAADLSQAFRRTSGVKVQWVGFLGFLVAGVPVSLAYLARFALDTELAFFATMAFMLAIGGYVWWLSVETAARVLSERREASLAALSRVGTPISS